MYIKFQLNSSPKCDASLLIQSSESKNINERGVGNLLSLLENSLIYINTRSISDIKRVLDFCKVLKSRGESTNYHARIDKILQATTAYMKDNSSLLGKRELNHSHESTSKKIKLELNKEETDLLKCVIERLEKSHQCRSLIKVLEQALNVNCSEWRECEDTNGYTILHFLWLFEDENAIKKIISQAQNINKVAFFDKTTPLHRAFQYPNVIKLLLESGANTQVLNNVRYTPFEEAIIHKCYESVEVFLEFQPDLINKSNNKSTPLSLAIYAESVPITDLLLRRGADYACMNNDNENVIYRAALTYNNEIMQLLHSWNKPIDLNANGETALIHACKKQNYKLVQFLVSCKANMDIYDSNFLTPLMHAIQLQNEEISLFLINNGANVQKNIESRYSPLLFAIDKGLTLTAHKLIDSGASLDVLSKAGSTVLDFVTTNKQLSFADIRELEAKITKQMIKNKALSQIYPRKFLAHFWGMGRNLYFYVAGQKISYTGAKKASLFVGKFNQYFLEYLPTLKEKFPVYFTDKIIQKLYLYHQKALVNWNLVERKTELIIQEAQECPQLLQTGWPGHATATVLFESKLDGEELEFLLAYCNKGQKMAKEGAVRLYSLKKGITPKHITKLRLADDSHYFEQLESKLTLEKVFSLKKQKLGNCCKACLDAAEFTTLMFLAFERRVDEYFVRKIFKALSSYRRQRELEEYLKNVSTQPKFVDWLLLAQIKNRIDQKLMSENLTDMQKENFNKAREHFKTYFPPENCEITNKNKDDILHYYIAHGYKQGIKETIKLGVNPKKLRRGTTPLQTAETSLIPGILEFVHSCEYLLRD